MCGSLSIRLGRARNPSRTEPPTLHGAFVLASLLHRAPRRSPATWPRKDRRCLMRSTTRALRHTTAVLVLSAFLAVHSPAFSETVLRVAMTAGDIPDWTGAPDQGYEGYRFVGFSLYDSMVEWDLSLSDKAADIQPGLAESWEVDPNDPKRWIFHLRKGVKFHDGCDWNAD